MSITDTVTDFLNKKTRNHVKSIKKLDKNAKKLLNVRNLFLGGKGVLRHPL